MKYLEQIATEGFFALTGSLDLTEHHIKSFLKVTPSKGPNLHKLKMVCPFFMPNWTIHRFQGLVFPSTNNHTSVKFTGVNKYVL